MKKGFTLIELLVVISIIGILIALSIFGLQGARAASRDGRRKADLEQVRSALEIYKADCNSYPTALTWGGSLMGGVDPPVDSCPATNQYISSVPIDPVPTQNYTYSSDGVTYTLCAALEQGGTTVSGCGSCGTPNSCNYSVTNP